MLPVGFETTISVGERPQTYALDLAATGTGRFFEASILNMNRRTSNVLPKRLQYKVLQK